MPNETTQSNPELSYDSDTGNNVTSRKRKQPDCEISNAIKLLTMKLETSLNDLKTEMMNNFSKMNDSISSMKSEVDTLSRTAADIKKEINTMRSQNIETKKQVENLDSKHTVLALEVSEIQSSLQFHSDRQDDLIKRMDNLEKSALMPATLSTLEAKIENLEQQARTCNIEITNVPEKRGENLITIVESIGNIVKCPITRKDIISVHRVPHAHKDNAKPKNIVVKLSSRVLRDNFLSAYRSNRVVKSELLGIAGQSFVIYLHEHLTLKKKLLFRECREAALQNKFKYVWVRNSTILTRKSDDSPIHAIKSHDDIKKVLFSNTDN